MLTELERAALAETTSEESDQDAVHSDTEEAWAMPAAPPEPNLPLTATLCMQEVVAGRKRNNFARPAYVAKAVRQVGAVRQSELADPAASPTLENATPNAVHPTAGPIFPSPAIATHVLMDARKTEPSTLVRRPQIGFVGRSSLVLPSQRTPLAALSSGNPDVVDSCVAIAMDADEDGSALSMPQSSEGAPKFLTLEPSAASAPPLSATAPPPMARPSSVSFSSSSRAPTPGTTLLQGPEGSHVLIIRRGGEREASPPPKKRAKDKPAYRDNFVRMDLKKGKGSSKYKASRRSQKFKPGRRRFKGRAMTQSGDGSTFLEGWQENKTSCYRCGAKGHWAAQCPESTMLAGAGSSSDEEGNGQGRPTGTTINVDGMQPVVQPFEPLQTSQSLQTCQSPQACLAPPCPLPLADLDCPTALAGVLREVFGHPCFRGRQLETIQAVVRGRPCLSVLPTGMGKSLCYQLPALVLGGLTVVVTPLIALMRDQAARAPAALRPALLWGGQTREEAARVLADVRAGRHHVVLVSPERLSNGPFQDALAPHLPLSLVVVDECHCVTEWGHSFRPSYYRLGGLLASMPQLRARSVLALTATATARTQDAICSSLGIPLEGVVRDAPLRANLRLCVAHKQQEPNLPSAAAWVVRLFTTGPLRDCTCAIVYCAFKGDTVTLAAALRGAGVPAAAYHAGKAHAERAAVEADLAAGRLRVVAATVAFGMGVHVPGLSAVVHASLPRSAEEYVQQIGRAGRGGEEARCFALLDDQDFVRMRSLAFASAAEEGAVHRLLQRALLGEERRGGRGVGRGLGSEGGDVLEETPETDDTAPTAPTSTAPASTSPAASYAVLHARRLAAELDLKEETLESALVHAELVGGGCLQILPRCALRARVSFYECAPEEAAERCPILRHVLNTSLAPRNGVYSCSTAALAQAAGVPPGVALQRLAEAAALKIVGFALSDEEGPALRLLRRPEAAEVAALASETARWLRTCLAHQVAQLDAVYLALRGAADPALAADEAEAALRAGIDAYMAGGLTKGADAAPGANLLEGLPLKPASPALSTAVRAALRQAQGAGVASKKAPLHPLALARMLHGLGSPAFSADAWRRALGPFWGSQVRVDFAAVWHAATVICGAQRDEADE